MIPQLRYSYRQQPSQLLRGAEAERGVLNLEAIKGLSFKARIIRGMDASLWLINQLGGRSGPHFEQEYGEEFIETTFDGKMLSLKLLEPRLIAHVESASVCTYLSDLIPESLVLYFLKPIVGCSPTLLPVKETRTVEKDVVRGIFFCMKTLGFNFSRLQERLALSCNHPDCAQLADYVTYHLTEKKSP